MVRASRLVGALFLIPVLTFSVTFSITYSSGKYNGHVLFLSSSIDHAPASCIGALFLSTTSALFALVVLVRQRQLESEITASPHGYLSSTVRFNTILGFAAAFGGNGVAAFQYHNAPIPHLIFATLFFLGGVVYTIINTWLDRRICSAPGSLIATRTCLSLAASVTFLAYLVLQFMGGPHRALYQSLSAAFEITTFLLFLLYFLTWSGSMSKMILDFTIRVDHGAALMHEVY